MWQQKRPVTCHPDEYRGCGSAPASSFQGSLVLPPTGSHGCFQLWATWRMTSCSSEINIHFRLTISVVDKLSSSSFFDLINSLNSLKLFIFRRSRFRDLGTRRKRQKLLELNIFSSPQRQPDSRDKGNQCNTWRAVSACPPFLLPFRLFPFISNQSWCNVTLLSEEKCYIS